MIHGFYKLIFKRWRVRRFQWFIAAIQPGPACSLLDVGGYWWNWQGRASAFGSILCVNPVEAGDGAASGEPNVRQCKGDGCALAFPDASFDVAFSNSVIEHVGNLEKQAAFAREVRRVGRKVWLQTPARECPFEPHLLAFGLHWIPGRLGYFARKYLSPAAWIHGPGSETMQDILNHTRLLSRREFEGLFPDCRIITERLFWILPKSYVAVRSNDDSVGSDEAP
ncbi:MAG: methyltransferase domain-containing protein [Verrucomicrobiota bacterium]